MSEIVTTNDPKQATFDKVALHLLNQGMKSVNDNGDCMYRGGNGRSCAIGCLITDDVYNDSVEGETSRSIGVLNMLYQSNPAIIGIDQVHDLIEDLQRLHDNASASSWEFYLIGIAKKYGLNTYSIVRNLNVREGLVKLGEAIKKQIQDESKTDTKVQDPPF